MKLLFSISLLFILASLLSAQVKDSVLLNKIDSLKAAVSDSVSLKDTTARKTSDVDTIIYASSSDSLFFFAKQKKMNIYGNAEVKYKETDLKSAHIYVDFNSHRIDAEGIPSDSVEGELVKTPVLKEGNEEYEGKTLTYNFKTAQGFISSAGTKLEGAIYTGEKIKKVTKDTYFIKDGIYTTCDAIPPHYYFYSPEMKVIQKSQIVAKWIWLYFGGVPFPIPVPFAVFPIESGRRSGILPPAFGQSDAYGTYFSRFGYFWAINDYMDINLTADYYTRGSYNLNSRFRYAKRYSFSGNLEGGLSKFSKR